MVRVHRAEKPNADRSEFDRRLADLLAPSPKAIAALARRIVALVAGMHPEMEAAVRFGWQSVSFRHPGAGYVCGVFPRPDRVLLLFEHGRQLTDPHGLLEGDTRQVRFIALKPGVRIPNSGIADLLAEAIALRDRPRRRLRR
jgi:hypothetical protein